MQIKHGLKVARLAVTRVPPCAGRPVPFCNAVLLAWSQLISWETPCMLPDCFSVYAVERWTTARKADHLRETSWSTQLSRKILSSSLQLGGRRHLNNKKSADEENSCDTFTVMVSVMPPSGVGGLPGFPVGGTTTSRYMETYYQPHQPYPQVSTTGKMASYVHYMRSKSAVNSVKRGRPARNVSTSSSSSSSTSINVAVKPISKCGLQGCTGCHVQTPVKWDPSKGDGGPPRVRPSASSNGGPSSAIGGPFKPLFVDCSVEYELPMVPKIPPDSQPLLVIHPGWQQKRRITRSSSHLMAAERRQFYNCLQCPSSSSVVNSSAVQNPVQQSSQQSTSSRKRTYGQINYSTELPPPVPAAGMCPLILLHLLLLLNLPWPLVVNMSPKGH